MCSVFFNLAPEQAVTSSATKVVYRLIGLQSFANDLDTMKGSNHSQARLKRLKKMDFRINTDKKKANATHREMKRTPTNENT